MMRRLLWLLAPLWSIACASTPVGPAFNTEWQNDQGASIIEVERQLRGTPPPPAFDVVVGLTADGIVGLPLDGGQRWSYPKTSDSPPVIAGELVLFSSNGELYALDAKSGKLLWEIGIPGHRLRGAGDDGKLTVASLGTLEPGEDWLVTVDRSGSVKEKLSSEKPLGRPAARGGLAFVPWSGQYVSVIDMNTGAERGRLLTRELVSHALTVGGEIYFGEKGVLHLDERIRYASTQQANRASFAERELPGKPKWLEPGERLPELDMGARAKTRIYATPKFSEKTRFASDRFISTYFQALMAFDAGSGELSWARAVPADILGADAASSGFVVCLINGKVLRFDAEGGDAGSLDLGTQLRGCVVEAGTLDIPKGEALPAKAAQLSTAITTLGPDMATAQLFMLAELGKLEDASVTKTLIDVSMSSRMAPSVRNEARRLLASRKSGAEFMLAALEAPFDFMSPNQLPAPVGPLADALAAMGERRAAPLLAKHLNDPANDMADVERAAVALGTLATPSEYDELRTFFALYR
ncbi:MAG: PQQ-binding-like beta-propeller repeat protein, partial [Myxococcota bacterium]|nr:PQQ-binding-like beta-propeller repeat protein [Myxococcota bacterium]